ncbi:GyrI-like domain-containing protein [Enterovibrio makurazakiensis]
MKFITISGRGNPNSSEFTGYIEALYATAYTIKMTLKNLVPAPRDYMDYTVYPLEGVWDITDEAKKDFNGTINKDDLIFKLMIRQPDFVTEKFFVEMLELAKKKKANPLLEQVLYESISEGKCVQMMHLGSFDDEPATFAIMEAFAEQQGLIRHSKIHRELYISDVRKVAPEKLKTTLRFSVT